MRLPNPSTAFAALSNGGSITTVSPSLIDPTLLSRILLAVVFVCSFAPSFAWSDEIERIGFNEQIRPILSENCFVCHGPDGESRAADLRLDQREDAVDFGAIVPGEPDESLIIERINETDVDTVMPPPESHKSLTTEQKQLLTDWVRQGAPYQRHWSFEPIAKEIDPSATIDGFVDAAIAKRKLTASAPASRERWLRRITFDLTGVPPTVDDLDAFLNDESDEAKETAIDRLLASTAYGERMAAEWLDVARYSDTYGYQVDRDRFVWPWRDWVIDSFNQNMPYDQFITEQIAGDLLPDATQNQILATTFNRLHPQKVEGGSVEEEFRVEYVVDRSQTVATAFMGLTLECARCHDHKFDPLSQKEYFQLSAYFANINEAGLYSFHTGSIPTPTLRLPTDDQREKLAQADAEVAALLTRYQAAVDAAGDKISEKQPSEKQPSENTDEPTGPPTGPAARLTGPTASQNFDGDAAAELPVELVDGAQGQSGKLSGDAGVGVGPAAFPRWQPFSVSLWLQTPDVKDRAVVFHQSLGWTDAASRGYELLIEDGKLTASIIHYWPGNAISVRTAAPIPIEKWQHVVVTYDGSSRASGLNIHLNGTLADCDVVQDALTKEISTRNNNKITIGERTRDRGFTNGLVDEFEIYDRELTAAEVSRRFRHEPFDGLLDDESFVALPESQRRELVAAYVDAASIAARVKLRQARQTRDQLLNSISEIMVMRELPEPRATHLLERGAYDAPAERVDSGTPAALPPMPEDQPNNRLGLARWLTSPDHPLTARVAVNRYWQLVFGRGLVVTTEDFGSQGATPSHPELLDWLSRRFIDSGWDVKGLLKTIALSAVYQRDSDVSESTRSQDPENIWLARGPVAPLTAEMIRDSALATSGLLTNTIGGPPARPYELAVAFKPVTPDKGEGLYRRSLYTYWKRTSPAPVMLILDASTRDVCRVRRERTSSPLQAMVLLNGPQYVEAAQGAAAEVLTRLAGETDSIQPTDDDAKSESKSELRLLFRWLTSRTPTDAELTILNRLYEEQQKTFAADPNAIDEYLNIGEFHGSDSLDKVKLASLAIVAQAVMNLDDTLMKR